MSHPSGIGRRLVAVFAALGCLAGSATPAFAVDPIRIDFGHEGSPVLDGFTRVTPFTSDEARATWTVLGHASQDQPWSDPLVDDQVMGGTLHLDLPPGDYALGALFEDTRWDLRASPGQKSGLRIGDDEIVVDTIPTGEAYFASRHYAANPRPVFTRDGSVFDRQIRPTLVWRTTTVTVGDAGLAVQPFGAPIAGLVVAPTDRATLEVDLALVDAQRRQWSLAHKPDSPTDALPWATAGAPRLEVVPWDRLPNPTLASSATSTAIQASPGQRISLLVAVHGPDDPAELSLNGLDAFDVQLHEVTWLDVVERGLRRPRPHVLAPTDGPVIAGQGLVPLVAVTLRVPDHAVPGRHTGIVTARRGDASATLRIDLRVRALHLAPPVSALGLWADLRGATASVYGADDPRTRAVWDADVAVMRDHDVAYIGLRGTYYPGPLSLLKPGVPTERLTWAVEAWRRGGGGRVSWVDPVFVVMQGEQPDDPAAPLSEAASTWLSEALIVSADLGIDVYISDEAIMAHGPGHRAHYTRLLDAINRLNAAHGARLAAATPHAAAWPLAASRVDLVFINRFPHLDPAHFEFFDGQRATPYAYNLSFHREATALYGWVLGAEATVIWHYNEPYNDPFNDARARPHYQLAILAPDGASVWPTRRLEDLSLGIQDQRVISTVSGLIDEVGHKRKAAFHVERACAMLRAAGSGIVGRQPEDFDDLGLFDDQSLDDLQRELGDIGETLAGWSKTQRAVRRGREAAIPASRWPARCGERPWVRPPVR